MVMYEAWPAVNVNFVLERAPFHREITCNFHSYFVSTTRI